MRMLYFTRPLLAKALYRAGILFAVLTVASASAETVDRVVARINNEIITERELRTGIKEVSGGQGTLNSENLGKFIDRKLVLQEAEKMKIGISDADLNLQVEEIVRDIRGKYPDDKSFRAALASEGMTMEKLKADLVKRTKTDYQVMRTVAASSINRDDTIGYDKREHGSENQISSIHLRRLGVPVGKGGSEAACQKLRELVQKINTQSLAFGDGIRKYSQVPGAAADGGDMGWMELSRLSPEVVAATQDLKPGQASAPVVIAGYANIFYVEGKRGNKAHQLEGQFNKRRSALLARLRQQAHVEMYSPDLKKLLPDGYAGRTTGSAPVAANPTTPGTETLAATPLPSRSAEPMAAPEQKRKGLLGLFSRKNNTKP